MRSHQKAKADWRWRSPTQKCGWRSLVEPFHVQSMYWPLWDLYQDQCRMLHEITGGEK